MKKNIQPIFKEPRRGDIKESWCDPFQAAKTLGFSAKIDLKKGLEEVLKPPF
jgi:UDP-glucose 4-epimerase